MKQLDLEDLEQLPGIRLRKDARFRFRCHPQIGCFNRCCRNLNLFILPYDVIRLKSRLGITSDEFLDRHADVVLRSGAHFPDVLLRMAENAEKTCPFLTDEGCSVYPDRPDTCRTFPLEQGLLHNAETSEDEPFFLFRPPEFCLGRFEEKHWTLSEWTEDQAAGTYHRMTIRWAKLRRLFQTDPWGIEGPTGRAAKMAFMAVYNGDRFREFVFGSSFLRRFKLKHELLMKIKKDDVELMLLGFDLIQLFLWGIRSRKITPRKR
jgi:Fe-S-cluster containining protein